MGHFTRTTYRGAVAALVLAIASLTFATWPVKLLSVREIYKTGWSVKTINPSTGGLTTVSDPHVLELRIKCLNYSYMQGMNERFVTSGAFIKAPVAIPSSGAVASQYPVTSGPWGSFGGDEGNNVAVFYIVIGSDKSFDDEIELKLLYSHWDTMTNSQVVDESTIKWKIYKVMAYDTAVDSRIGFGAPNEAGELTSDPNEPFGNVKFAGYKWHGGGFVGFVPPSAYFDNSGTARTQYWPYGAPTPDSGSAYGGIVNATLTVLDMGTGRANSRPSGGVGGSLVTLAAPDIGVYVTGSSDSNGSVTQDAAVWSNKWTITTDNTEGSYSGGPTATRAWATIDDGAFGTITSPTYSRYMNFCITKTDSDNENHTWYCTPDYRRGVSLAIFNEAYTEASGPACWRYFASEEYERASYSLPEGRRQPRVWVVMENGSW